MNKFSNVLMQWYATHRRALPWRNTTDPYLIWISEIILQQTRVAQGYDYFQRFVQRFPDVGSLASAHEDEVLKYWQGLGYYSRARNLYYAACSMNGVFPATYEGVRALKGVGDYTAAAICSAAYGMPYAVVDGNVYRVLARYFAIDVPIDSTLGKKTFAALAQELLDLRHPADYNQAIMDFGALQCTPQSPGCDTCPLADSCSGLLEGRVSELPVKQKKIQQKERYFNYIFVRMGPYTCIRKRIEDDIWQNLYELPLIETAHELSQEEFLALPAFRDLLCKGEEPLLSMVCRRVKHVLSHRIIYANFYEVTLPESSLSFSSFQKVRLMDLEEYALPRLVHAFLEKYV